MPEPALAVDFGTSRTKVAWRDSDGEVHLLHFDGIPYLPSLFYLPSGSDETLLGVDAHGAYIDDPLGVVEELKRSIARNARIRTTEDRSTDAQSLLTALFKHINHRLLDEVEAFDGIPPEEVWLTVPATDSVILELTLRQAAHAVGWHRAQVLAEPVAAARYWLYGDGYSSASEAKVVVLDVGGGTSDWSYLQRTGTRIHDPGQFKPSAIGVGSTDVDRALCAWVKARHPDLYEVRPEPQLQDNLRGWKEARLSGAEPPPMRIRGKPLALNDAVLAEADRTAVRSKILPTFEQFLQPIIKQHPDVTVLLVGGGATAWLEHDVQALHPQVRRSEDRIGAVIRGALAGMQQIRPKTPPDIHGWPADKVQALQQAAATALKLPVFYQHSLPAPAMAVIPAGSFIMGSPPGEPERLDREGPQHRVTFARPFAIGRYAVTFEDYDRFCEATRRDKPDDDGWGRGSRPVIYVNRQDALDYCAWLSQQTGQRYRLPSEAGWEYACRAGTTTPFWWGASITPNQANYDGNDTYNGGRKGKYREKTVPVHEFQPNPWGLYQMHGNVEEWCEDGWHVNYHGAPNDGSANTNGSTDSCVVRGGSWYYFPDWLLSAFRFRNDIANRTNYLGFRLAQSGLQPGMPPLTDGGSVAVAVHVLVS